VPVNLFELWFSEINHANILMLDLIFVYRRSFLAMGISIEPTGSALGAYVRNIDLNEPLTSDLKQTILSAWNEHIVLIFPDQNLNQKAQLDFASNFGSLGTRSRRAEARPEGAEFNPNIMMVSNLRDEKGNYIGSLPDGEMYFHHDMCYMPEPHRGTYLYAIEIPSRGGNTKFTNMYRAYENLPEDLKTLLDTKTAVQVYDYDQTSTPDVQKDLSGIHHRSQPIFIRHPQTNKTALYVNRLMTAIIDGMDRSESDQILSQLHAISESTDNVYEHVWTVGDLVMWDNFASCHARTDFPAAERRVMRRCTTEGGQMIAARQAA
jgi:taurine dioxygenase